MLPSRAQLLAEAGARCVLVPAGEGGIDLAAGLKALGARGLTRLLVEGGGALAAGLLRADLVDRLVWFAAPGVIGADGKAGVAALGLDSLAQMTRFAPMAGPLAVGMDVMSEFARVS
jgi:diaminohydroxyphosphoribosylaminopyrimidine deaminase/5-amino-6-(5-phosphoribosylamino)uracil reductase